MLDVYKCLGGPLMAQVALDKVAIIWLEITMPLAGDVGHQLG